MISATPDGQTHRLRWVEWGDFDNSHIVICAHGLSRNSRDFDFLAHALANDFRVICPDYPGRGNSDPLSNPVYYNNEQYLQDSRRMIEALAYEQLHWIGTSMGGLIGMGLAVRSDNPISRLVLNDVGAFIPGQALAQIAEYLGNHPQFNTLDEAEIYYRTTYASFGLLDDVHYHHLVEHGVRPAPDGEGYVLDHDKKIIDQFVSLKVGDIDLWDYWHKIDIPTLIIRGQHSTLLMAQTVEQMKHRHRGAKSIEIANCAHAPSLMVTDQIASVRDWLHSS